MAVNSIEVNDMGWKVWGLEKIADIIVDAILEKSKLKKGSVFNKPNDRNIREVIKNTENQNTIIAKSQIQDFNTKSILFVMPGEEAVFINDGEIVGILSEGKHVLDTLNYPFLSDMISLISGKQRIHCSSLYFVRSTISQPLDWGTSLQVRDPLQLISTRVMCRGVYRIQIVNSKNLIKYFIGNGWERLEQQEFSHLIQGEIIQFVKAYLTEYIMKRNEEILGINSEQRSLSIELGELIKNKYIQYGFKIVSFSVIGMDILERDSNRKNIEETYMQKRIAEIKKSN